jgi:hypothetical protein
MLCIRGNVNGTSSRDRIHRSVDGDISDALQDMVDLSLDVAMGAEMARGWWADSNPRA